MDFVSSRYKTNLSNIMKIYTMIFPNRQEMLPIFLSFFLVIPGNLLVAVILQLFVVFGFLFSFFWCDSYFNNIYFTVELSPRFRTYACILPQKTRAQSNSRFNRKCFLVSGDFAIPVSILKLFKSFPIPHFFKIELIQCI